LAGGLDVSIQTLGSKPQPYSGQEEKSAECRVLQMRIADFGMWNGKGVEGEKILTEHR
jgi:hypothetical protein